MYGNIPKWHLAGDWFDVCNCNIPCPCEFAQAPTFGDCSGILAYHIREGNYGNLPLSGLNLIALGSFTGNLWAGEAKVIMGFFIDERGDSKQREALQMIFSGKAGGFPAELAKFLGEVRGMEFTPIEIEIDDGLATWRAEIPGRVFAKAEALTGPMTPPGKRVQTINPPGSEVGPGAVATWGKAIENSVDALGFKWNWAGRSSKHIKFNWTGP
jgi:hypothetical protein